MARRKKAITGLTSELSAQLRLAKERGEFHIGASAKQTQIDRSARKRDYRQSQRQLTED